MDDVHRLMKMCDEKNLVLKVVDNEGLALQVCGPRGGVRKTVAIDDDGEGAVRAMIASLEAGRR